MEEKHPIISKILKQPFKSEEQIGIGNETRHLGGVTRRVHKVEAGEISYAEKLISPVPIKKEVRGKIEVYYSEREAKRIMQTYKDFKSFGLPVLDLFKIHRFKDSEGKIKYKIIMEDLTENDKYEVAQDGTYLGYFANFSDEPMLLLRKMVQALAVIHNNGYYESELHPTVSFCARREKMDMEELDVSLVDFKVIDYSNFVKSDPNISPNAFESFTHNNISNFESYLWDYFTEHQRIELLNYYDELRKEGVRTFTSD